MTLRNDEAIKLAMDQFSKIWEIYIKFYTVFYTANLAILGYVVTNQREVDDYRWLLAAAFGIGNVMSSVTATLIAVYSYKICKGFKDLDAPVLGSIMPAGVWGGLANAIGGIILGVLWVVFAIAP